MLFVLRYIIGGLFGQRNGYVVLGGLKELCICLKICCRGNGGMPRIYNLIRNNEGAPYISHNIGGGLCYEVPRLVYFYGQAWD